MRLKMIDAKEQADLAALGMKADAEPPELKFRIVQRAIAAVPQDGGAHAQQQRGEGQRVHQQPASAHAITHAIKWPQARRIPGSAAAWREGHTRKRRNNRPAGDGRGAASGRSVAANRSSEGSGAAERTSMGR